MDGKVRLSSTGELYSMSLHVDALNRNGKEYRKECVCVCVCVYLCVYTHICMYNESLCYTTEINTTL